jgi:hypothetical protein
MVWGSPVRDWLGPCHRLHNSYKNKQEISYPLPRGQNKGCADEINYSALDKYLQINRRVLNADIVILATNKC